MTFLRLVVRRLRDDPWPAVLLTAAVAVAVALATLLPRTAADLRAETLRGAVASTSAQQRDLMAQWTDRPRLDDRGADPASDYLAAADELRHEQPRPLGELLGAPELVADVGGPISLTPPVETGYYRVGIDVQVDARLQEHSELVTGTWPAPPVPDEEPTEVVMLADAADRLGWAVGDEAAPGTRLAGTFRPVAPDDPRWEHVPRAVRYAELVDPNRGTELVTALYVHPAALAVGAIGQRPQITHHLWYGLDPGAAATAADLGLLSSQLSGFLGSSHTLAAGDETPEVEIRFYSELGRTLESVATQQRTLVALLAAVATGPLALSALVVGTAARLVRERRRTVTALTMARGLSPRQLALSTGAESAALATVGALLGHAGAALAMPMASMSWQWAVTAALAVVLALGITAMLASEGRVATPRRLLLAAELAVLLLAVTATVLLLRGTPGDARTDLLAIGAPVLITVGATLVVWRYHGAPLRALARRLAGGRGLPRLLGVLRAAREPSGGIVAMLAVVTGVSMAFLGTSLSSSLARSAEDAAWSANGAEINVSGPRMSGEIVERIRLVDGVEEVARVARVADSAALSTSSEVTYVGVWAADEELTEVYADTPLDPRLPLELFEDGVPTAVVAGGSARPAGTAGELAGIGPVRILGHRESLPGVGTQSGWALVAADAVGDVIDDAALALVSVTDGASQDDVAAALRAQLPTAVVTTAGDQLDSRRMPAAGSFGAAVSWAGVGAVLLMLVAVVSAEAAGAEARRRALELLAALGMPARDRRRSIVWEVAPLFLLSMVVGVALGLGTAVLLLRALDFSFITGAEASLALDPGSMAATAGLVVGSFVLVVATARGRSRRRPAWEGS